AQDTGQPPLPPEPGMLGRPAAREAYGAEAEVSGQRAELERLRPSPKSCWVVEQVLVVPVECCQRVHQIPDVQPNAGRLGAAGTIHVDPDPHEGLGSSGVCQERAGSAVTLRQRWRSPLFRVWRADHPISSRIRRVSPNKCIRSDLRTRSDETEMVS